MLARRSSATCSYFGRLVALIAGPLRLGGSAVQRRSGLRAGSPRGRRSRHAEAGHLRPGPVSTAGIVDGAKALAALADDAGARLPIQTYTVRTASGGQHRRSARPAHRRPRRRRLRRRASDQRSTAAATPRFSTCRSRRSHRGLPGCSGPPNARLHRCSVRCSPGASLGRDWLAPEDAGGVVVKLGEEVLDVRRGGQ